MDIEREAADLLCGLGSVPSMRDVFDARMGGEVREIASLPAGDAACARHGDEWIVYVRASLHGARLRWAIAHEVAEIHLARLGVGGDVEQLAERLAGALTMPRDRFVTAAIRERMCLRALARGFMVSETAAALRLAEADVLAGAAVVHPHFRLVRGSLSPDRTAERRITDAPRRVALLCA